MTVLYVIGSISQENEIKAFAESKENEYDKVIYVKRDPDISMKELIERGFRNINEATDIAVIKKPDDTIGIGTLYEVTYAESLHKNIIYVDAIRPDYILTADQTYFVAQFIYSATGSKCNAITDINWFFGLTDVLYEVSGRIYIKQEEGENGVPITDDILKHLPVAHQKDVERILNYRKLYRSYGDKANNDTNEKKSKNDQYQENKNKHKNQNRQKNNKKQNIFLGNLNTDNENDLATLANRFASWKK